MKYKAVLFDMNGVIVNDEPLHLAAFQAAMRDRGQVLSEQQYKQYFAGRTDKDGFVAYMSAIGQEYDLGQMMQVKAKAYLDMAQDTLKPYEGIVDFIQALDSAGISLALVTSSLRTEAHTVLQTFGITNYFRAVITADDIKNGKPDPEGYLKGAAALQVEPSGCVVIEDAPSGVQAARSAGMRCIAVLNTHTSVELGGAGVLVDRLDRDSLDLLK